MVCYIERAMFLFFVLSLCSCRSIVLVKDEKAFANYLAQIETHNKKITQVKASLDIKGQGFLGSFFHEQADIIAQDPYNLYWSLRSFFGPPALVLACNGRFITIYDFLGTNQPYQKLSLTKGDNYLEIMDFVFHPHIIYLLMGKIPLGTQIELKTRGQELLVNTDLKDGWSLETVFDMTLGRVLKTKLQNKRQDVVFKASFKDFELTSGIYFPKLLVLQAKGKAKADLEIRFSNIDLNGDPVSSKVFYLEPH